MMVMSVPGFLLGTEIPFFGFRRSLISLVNIGHHGRGLSGSRQCGRQSALSASAGGIWDSTLAKHDNNFLLQVDNFLGVLIDLN